MPRGMSVNSVLNDYNNLVKESGELKKENEELKKKLKEYEQKSKFLIYLVRYYRTKLGVR